MTDHQPEAITQAELAEAWEHEVDGCYAGGREFAVNVFAYVRERRKPGLVTEWPPVTTPAPPPVAAAFDREAVRQVVSEAIEKAWWSQGGPASEEVMRAIWPLLERAGAAEGKLAEILALPLLYIGTVAEGNAVVSYPAIREIIGSEKGSCDA